MSWTDDKVELLRQLWLDGRSASQISAALGQGLTRNAVIGKVHRLGLAGRAKTSSANPGSLATPRAAAPRRMAPRAATGGGAGGGSGGGGGGARGGGGSAASGHVVHGNTVMALMHDTADIQPLRKEEDVVVPMSLRVTIVELREAMCRWPLGDPTTAEFRYCGSPAPGATPYCTYHGKLAYQPVQDRRRERDRERRTLIAH